MVPVLKQVLGAVLPKGHPAMVQMAAGGGVYGGGYGGGYGSSSSSGPNKAAIISSIQVGWGKGVLCVKKARRGLDWPAVYTGQLKLHVGQHTHTNDRRLCLFVLVCHLHAMCAGQCQPCPPAGCDCSCSWTLCGGHTCCHRHVCAPATAVLCVTRPGPEHVSFGALNEHAVSVLCTLCCPHSQRTHDKQTSTAEPTACFMCVSVSVCSTPRAPLS